MSKSKKKAARRMSAQRLSESDMYDDTINDLANLSVISGSGRLKKKKKKNCINKFVAKVKQLSLVEDDRSWDEKVNDLEVIVGPDDEQEVKKTSSHRRKKAVCAAEECPDDQTGYNYPIEVWFLISDHIRPEDVGKFAAICKASLAVVSTAKFWYNLYKRYYKKVADLPERLQPECMVRRYGLRAYVIRALHFMYPPFVKKLKPQVNFDRDLHILTKRLCVLSWSQKKKNQWLFYFKLKQPEICRYGREEDDESTKLTLLEKLEDITANMDNNCKMLRVTCMNYTPLPMISGQILSGVSLKPSSSMSYSKLQLSFGCGPLPSTYSNLITLDSVLSLRILDWWHPLFPHCDGLNSSSLNLDDNNCPFDELEF